MGSRTPIDGTGIHYSIHRTMGANVSQKPEQKYNYSVFCPNNRREKIKKEVILLIKEISFYQ